MGFTTADTALVITDPQNEGFAGSRADWLPALKPHLEDQSTVVVSPHEVYGPQNNDLALQLRKRGINKVLLAGMSANLCVESHLRDLVEQGFEVGVVKDATAAAKHPELGDGYARRPGSVTMRRRPSAPAPWTPMPSSARRSPWLDRSRRTRATSTTRRGQPPSTCRLLRRWREPAVHDPCS